MKAKITIELSDKVIKEAMKNHSLSTKDEVKALLYGLWEGCINQLGEGIANLTIEVEE